MAETLPAMQHDPGRLEDVLKVDADEDGVGGDDTADALRYLVVTKSREIRVRKLRGVRPSYFLTRLTSQSEESVWPPKSISTVPLMVSPLSVPL
jgi:hypothetical protein